VTGGDEIPAVAQADPEALGEGREVAPPPRPQRILQPKLHVPAKRHPNKGTRGGREGGYQQQSTKEKSRSPEVERGGEKEDSGASGEGRHLVLFASANKGDTGG
jgi:hypothetical protein